MNQIIPDHCPECVISILNRSEWFRNPGIVRRVCLNYARGLPWILSSSFFSRQTIGAITLGNTVYFRLEDQYNPHTPSGLAFLAHEIKHVEQYERDGLINFYTHYLMGYLRNGYGKLISYEGEAYAFQVAVYAHLEMEFRQNHEVQPCLELDAPHTPNPAFNKLPTPLFSYL
jgi:hypothetical protein